MPSKFAAQQVLLSPLPLLAFLLLFGCGAGNGKSPEVKFDPGRTQALTAFLHGLQEGRAIPGTAIAVINNDSVYYNGSGISNTENQAFTGTTPILTGSLSEPMLATAVMKLAESGKVSLDDPVIKYLPYFKMGDRPNKKVTIRHLLTHTSGVQHYDVMWDVPNFSPSALEVTTKSIASQVPKFPVPGSRVSRSPYNYDILADLICKATGIPFEDYVTKNVFEPLEMKASTFKKPSLAARPFHIENWLKYTVKQDSLYPYNREYAGSNGFHTTAKDLTNWMSMLLSKGKNKGRKFIETDFFKDLFAAQYRTGAGRAIGFGWEISETENKPAYTKSSNIGNFSSYIILIPGKHMGVAVMANITDDFNPGAVADAVISWLEGKKLPAVKASIGTLMGRRLALTGNLDSAFKTYRILKERAEYQYDFSPEAINKLGNNLVMHFKDEEKAIRVFEFCISEYPSSAAAYLDLSKACLTLKKYGKAISALNQAKIYQKTEDEKARVREIEEYIKILSYDAG